MLRILARFYSVIKDKKICKLKMKYWRKQQQILVLKELIMLKHGYARSMLQF